MKKDIIRVFIPNIVKAFAMFISAFMIPKVLSIDEYGYIKLFQLYVSYIGISSMGYCESVFIRYGGESINSINRQTLANDQRTILLYQVLLTVVITVGAIIKGDYILIMFGLSFLPSVLLTYYLMLSQALGMFKEYAMIYSIHSFMTIIVDLICLFIFQVQSGKTLIFASVMTNYIVVLFIYFTFTSRYNLFRGSFKLNMVRENMQMGILIMAGNMAYVVYTGIDKWFVKICLGMTSFSYYSFATQLLSIVNMLSNPIAYTLFNYMSKESSEAFEYKMQRLIQVWLFFILSGVYVLKVIIRCWISKYVSVIPILVVLFYSQLFYCLNIAIYVNLFKVYKKQKSYFIKLLLVIVLSVGLNGLFFFLFRNMISFALATALCMIVWTCLNMQNFPYLRLKRKDLLFMAGMSVSYFIINYFVPSGMDILIYVVVFSFFLKICMPDIFNTILVKITKE